MMDWINGWDADWFWLVAGVVLAIAEILVPGFFMIWLAAAAIATGLIAMLLPIAMPLQILLFAVLAVAAVYAGRRWFALNPIESSDPKLNDRGARLVGETVTVVEAISNGRGRVKVGDGVWIAKGPDAAVGANVRVTGSDGSTLLVEDA
ncbi:MAG: NfeD family protein [Sphingomonadales bacterium]|mgnify:FL=1|jgi:membrane protein implicated in regulation of membrane protease activity|nr:NfeD family protein [Sphingomonadales bacterium]MBP7136760.1 NfeD family protein [Sphingomonadaceae bacterium]MBK6490498.1 NfeD family protein [Sphingomonadales bacterium]MBK6719545.1 NfeD family protein [Sphingomonadales bacterium]MBK7284204.1 NfeD family protein [Sphingomonadales bacterium]